MVLDGYRVEIEQIDHQRVVLAIPALRLLVLGRSLDDALERARAAIGFRVHDDDWPRQRSFTLARRAPSIAPDGRRASAPTAA